MKTFEKIFVAIVGIVLIGVLLFSITSEVNVKKNFEMRNSLCVSITEEMNRNINSTNSTCVDYYCYYAPYSSPDGMEHTETLCICECRKADGSVIKSQILENKIAY